MTSPDVMTAREAAEYLRVSERTLIRMRNARVGPPWTYIGSQLRYRRVDLLDYLERQRIEPVRGGAA